MFMRDWKSLAGEFSDADKGTQATDWLCDCNRLALRSPPPPFSRIPVSIHVAVRDAVRGLYPKLTALFAYYCSHDATDCWSIQVRWRCTIANIVLVVNTRATQRASFGQFAEDFGVIDIGFTPASVDVVFLSVRHITLFCCVFRCALA